MLVDLGNALPRIDGRIASVQSGRRFFDTKRNQYFTRSRLAVCSSMQNSHVGSRTRFSFVCFLFRLQALAKAQGDFLFSR
jgi:hypothetical protein